MFEVVEKMLETLITNKTRIQDYIYKDELSKNRKVGKPRKLQRSPKIIGYYREGDEESSKQFKEVTLPLLPSVIPEDVERSCKNDAKKSKVNNVRVKVLLTKIEAEELLAKYKKEMNLEIKDVVNDLMKLPAQRVNVVPIFSFCQDTELSTIPEEEGEYEDDDEDEDEEIISTGMTCC